MLFLQTFQRIPRNSDWGRFRYYAPRIQNLTRKGDPPPPWPPLDFEDEDEPTPTPPISPEVFSHLLSVTLPPGFNGLLLPNLKELTWEFEDSESLAQVLHFNYPSLKAIRLNNPDFDLTAPLFSRVLDTFSQNGTRNLEELYINGRIGSGPRNPTLEQWIRDQKGLKSLSVGGIVIDQPLRTLKDLHCLTVVDVVVPFRSDAEASVVTQLLAKVAPGLTTVEINFFLSRAAGSAIRDPSLRKWTFIPLKPLLKLKHLVRLALIPPVPIVLGDEDIKSMASSWPKLRDLCLAPEPWAGDLSTGTSLATIPKFVMMIPTLNTLEHRFVGFHGNATIPPRPSASTGPRREFYLNVGTSPLASAQTNRLHTMLTLVFWGMRVAFNHTDDDSDSEQDDAWRTASRGLYFL